MFAKEITRQKSVCQVNTYNKKSDDELFTRKGKLLLAACCFGICLARAMFTLV